MVTNGKEIFIYFQGTEEIIIYYLSISFYLFIITFLNLLFTWGQSLKSRHKSVNHHNQLRKQKTCYLSSLKWLKNVSNNSNLALCERIILISVIYSSLQTISLFLLYDLVPNDLFISVNLCENWELFSWYFRRGKKPFGSAQRSIKITFMALKKIQLVLLIIQICCTAVNQVKN